jgi:hypothetical protein
MKSCKFNRTSKTTHKIAPQMFYFMGSIIIQPMELGPTDDNYFICCRMTSFTRGQASGQEVEEEEEDEGRKNNGEGKEELLSRTSRNLFVATVMLDRNFVCNLYIKIRIFLLLLIMYLKHIWETAFDLVCRFLSLFRFVLVCSS